MLPGVFDDEDKEEDEMISMSAHLSRGMWNAFVVPRREGMSSCLTRYTLYLSITDIETHPFSSEETRLQLAYTAFFVLTNKDATAPELNSLKERGSWGQFVEGQCISRSSMRRKEGCGLVWAIT